MFSSFIFIHFPLQRKIINDVENGGVYSRGMEDGLEGGTDQGHLGFEVSVFWEEVLNRNRVNLWF